MHRFLLSTVSIFCLTSSAALAQTVTPPTPVPPPPGAPAIAVPAAPVANPGAPVTRAELPALIKQTLLDDPKILMEVVKKLHDQQIEDNRKENTEALQHHKADLFSDTSSPSTGPKDADVTIVEFFDYHCGYCKRLLPELTQLLSEDKKVRIIFREFPILSDESVTAAKAALAVNNIAPDKYFAFHTDMMQASGKLDEKAILGIAKKQGIGAEKLKAEMSKQSIADQIEADRRLAEDLGIRGTPALIIGDELIPGAMPLEQIKKQIADVRGGKQASEPAPQDLKATGSANPPPVNPAAGTPTN